MTDTCTWTRAHDWDWDYWETECGEAFCMTDGNPEENHYRFCPGCGRKLVAVIPPMEDDDDWLVAETTADVHGEVTT